MRILRTPPEKPVSLLYVLLVCSIVFSFGGLFSASTVPAWRLSASAGTYELISSADARVALRTLLDLTSLDESLREKADRDKDGILTAYDVRLLQWQAVGIRRTIRKAPQRFNIVKVDPERKFNKTETAEEAVFSVPSDENAELRQTRNLWSFGDQSFVSSQLLSGIHLPEGEYVVSAEIISYRNGTEAASDSARIAFLDGEKTVASVSLSRNCRASAIIDLDTAVDSVMLYASDTRENSENAVSLWNNVQIESGDLLTSFIPHEVTGDPDRQTHPETLFSLEDVSVPRNWVFSFVLGEYDARNLLIECESQFTGTNENSYIAPKFCAYYTVKESGTTKYYIGKREEPANQTFRLPPYPGFTNQYKNTVHLAFFVPEGFSVRINRLTVRCDSSFTRDSNGVQIDTHGAFMFYPEHSLAAARAAAACGASRFIVIPKRSSDGVWFAYHDDSFVSDTTKLRNPDGSRITYSPYEGKRFREIPFDYLNALDWGLYKNAVFAGTKPLLIKELFDLCAQTGMKPLFSMHPQYTATELNSMRELAESCGMLDKLSLKPTSDGTERSGSYFKNSVLPVFGNDIEEYILIQKRAAHSDEDVRGTISILDSCDIDREKVIVAIELWIDLATPEQIQMILDAGYRASLVSFKHTGPDGTVHSYIESDDYLYWTSLGVTEFTDQHNTAFGQNWLRY